MQMMQCSNSIHRHIEIQGAPIEAVLMSALETTKKFNPKKPCLTKQKTSKSNKVSLPLPEGPQKRKNIFRCMDVVIKFVVFHLLE